MADSIDDLVDQAQQPEGESAKLKALLRENARLRRKLDERESGWEIIRGVLEDVYDAPSNLTVTTPKKSTKSSEEVAVLHLTDVHYGKETETYNVGLCEARMVSLCDAVGEITSLRRKYAKIDRLILLFGGDFVEGDGIFPGQAHETDADVIQQAVKEGPEMYANVVLSLAQTFRSIEVHGCPGNHGRQSRFSSKRHNLDSVCYEIVRKMVERAPKVGDRITWNLPLDRAKGNEWYAHFPIIGEHAGLLVHGDQIRGSMGYSWYGWAKKASGWRTAPDVPEFRYLFGGHWHTHGSFDVNDTTIFATGSPETHNSYALETLAAAGDPKQRLCFFNKSKGLLSDNPLMLKGPVDNDLS